MGSRHDLAEFGFACEVVEKFPMLIKELERTLKILRTCSSFAAAAHSTQAILESLEMLEHQLRYYTFVKNNKGQN